VNTPRHKVIVPHPRKASHASIANTIIVASSPIATFLLLCTPRGCVDVSRNSLSAFVDRWRSFIRPYRSETSEE
jgi:hypothetical protein